MRIKLNLKVESIDASDLEQDPELKKRLTSQCVVIESRNAQFVEFGTTPARRATYTAGESPVLKRIREWCAHKWGLTEGSKELDRRSRYLYHKIMENGLAPSPFIRPALETLKDELTKAGDEWTSLVSLEELAEFLAEQLRVNLIQDDHIYTGELLDSIYVTEYYDEGESPGNPEYEELWADPRAGVGGKTASE